MRSNFTLKHECFWRRRRFPAQHPDPIGLSEMPNEHDIDKLIDCIDRPNCRVRDIKGLSAVTKNGTEHPTDPFRGLLMLRMAEKHPIPTHNEWIPVCAAVNRNAAFLWEMAQDEYFKRKSWVE